MEVEPYISECPLNWKWRLGNLLSLVSTSPLVSLPFAKQPHSSYMITIIYVTIIIVIIIIVTCYACVYCGILYSLSILTWAFIC